MKNCLMRTTRIVEENPLFVCSPSHGLCNFQHWRRGWRWGVKVVIMAELLGANEGVGAQIADARAMLDTSTVMAYVLLVDCICFPL